MQVSDRCPTRISEERFEQSIGLERVKMCAHFTRNKKRINMGWYSNTTMDSIVTAYSMPTILNDPNQKKSNNQSPIASHAIAYQMHRH